MTIRARITSLLFALLLAGCAAAAPQDALPAGGGIQAWVDAPLSGTVLALPVTYPVVCHGTSPRGVSLVEFSVNETPVGTISNPSPEEHLLTARFEWSPAGPGMYLLGCRARDPNGAWSLPFTARVEVLAAAPTATSEQETLFRVSESANCRSGPSTRYPLVTSFSAGTLLPALGRNEDSSWLMVENRQGGNTCWISRILGEVQGSPDGLPAVTVAPPPEIVTDTPVAGCWISSLITAPVCTVPCPTGVPNNGPCTP